MTTPTPPAAQPCPPMDAMDELLPCPFCGGDALVDSNEDHGEGGHDTWLVICGSLNCYGNAFSLDTSFYTRAHACEAWNTRTARPVAAALTEERGLDETIAQRDAAEDCIEELMKLVGLRNGQEYEWSSAFGYAEAIELAEDALHETVQEAAKAAVDATALAARPVAAAVSEETIEKAWDAAFYDWCNETGDKSSRERAIETLRKHLAATPGAPTNPAPISTKLVDAEVTPGAQGGEVFSDDAEIQSLIDKLGSDSRFYIQEVVQRLRFQRENLRAQLEAVTKELLDAQSALSLATTHVDCLQKQTQPTPVAHGAAVLAAAERLRSDLNYWDKVNHTLAAGISCDDLRTILATIPTTNGAEGAR